MFWNMLRQSWKNDVNRKLMAVLTVFLATSLISALLIISIGIGDKISYEMKNYGANIKITPAGQVVLPKWLDLKQRQTTQDFLAERDLPQIKDIFWRNNIVGFAPWLQGEVEARVDNEKTQSILIKGTFFDKSLPIRDEEDYHTGNKIISSYWKITGKWAEDDKNQALIGKQLAKKTGWKQNTVVHLNGKQNIRVTIAGILDSGDDNDDSLILSLSDAQKLLGLQGKIQSINVSALTVPENELSHRAHNDLDTLDADEYDRWFCTAYASSISFQLEKALSNVVVNPVWQVAASEGVIISKIQSLLFMVTLAALLAAAMGISSLMTNAILQRSKEIGLMKALGATVSEIYLLFYSESILCSLIGGLLGCLVGWLLSLAMGYALFGSFISFHWVVMFVVIIVSILIALIGTWFPARRITHLYPVEVLYGNQ
ncbi:MULTISPECIES: ABC transporter permease [Pasteurellaceae]|uniref:ABC transporter permease n=1 Tax=Pasteurella atlantica TaxID=2827233 RepID=A0AAW8CI12_9PAST|nr:ABC transporter permease [Pasteurella atlantica]MBR0572640.1 ABC transporter permease [Pasteurella atlantica]MDP8038586.1 ABC transporter permease [Pasteurella atlantica]MDP8040678.1 ABC transporter permease [Pasteurella atlantica]MDP8042813.1 ABC transporter permease [Pasteurella atlantica]MDP8044900.1 ABC transporter permease [Pasteurella atlantica]